MLPSTFRSDGCHLLVARLIHFPSFIRNKFMKGVFSSRKNAQLITKFVFAKKEANPLFST